MLQIYTRALGFDQAVIASRMGREWAQRPCPLSFVAAQKRTSRKPPWAVLLLATQRSRHRWIEAFS